MISYELNVVVTAYNNGKYIRKCLESVVKQRETYDNFRVTIGYDISSRDDTGDICMEFVNKYPYISIKNFHKSWVGKVRNRVAEGSKEDFITFVDGDDYLPEGALYEMMSRKKDDTDCIIGDMMNIYPSGRTKIMPKMITNGIHTVCCSFMHPVIFKTELYVKELRCLENIKTHEDRPSGYLISKKSKGTVFVDVPVYCYCVRPKSSIRNAAGRVNMLKDIMEVVHVMETYKNLYVPGEWKLIMDDLEWSGIASLMFVYTIKDKIDRINTARLYWDTLEKTFPYWRVNPILKSMEDKPFVGTYVKFLIHNDLGKEYLDFTESYKMKIIEIGTEKYALNGWIDLFMSKIKRG